MWEITNITCPNGTSGTIFGGKGTNMAACSLNQSLLDGGAMYVVQMEGHGSITLSATNSPGSQGIGYIIVNNNPSLSIAYSGTCSLSLSVDDLGNVTISGGTPAINTKVYASMSDMDILVPYLTLMVAQSPALQSQWQNDVMALLGSMGFPESAMTNLDADYVTAYIALLQEVTFPSGNEVLPEEASLFLEAHRTKNYAALDTMEPRFQSWKCTFCKIGVLAVATVLLLLIIGIIAVFTGPQGVIVSYLAGQAVAGQAAVLLGLTATQVATVVVSAAAITGVAQAALGDVAEGLCQLMNGAC